MPALIESIPRAERQLLSIEPARVQSPRLSKSPHRVKRKTKHDSGVSMDSYVVHMSGYVPGPLIFNS